MAEDTVSSIDSLAYRVNNLSDLDGEVVTAHEQHDEDSLNTLLSESKHDYDVFVCVNELCHAFTLCVTGREDGSNHELSNIPNKNPCCKIDLRFENDQLRIYKIRKKDGNFEKVRGSIDRSYYVGKYRGTSKYALDLAAVRVAPRRYNTLLNDCMEFAKRFCIQLSEYCNNGQEFKEVVKNTIKNATATGFSVETLSRRVPSSAISGNLVFGGGDASSFLYGTHRIAFWVAVGFFVIICQIVLIVVVVKLLKYYDL